MSRGRCFDNKYPSELLLRRIVSATRPRRLPCRARRIGRFSASLISTTAATLTPATITVAHKRFLSRSETLRAAPTWSKHKQIGHPDNRRCQPAIEPPSKPIFSRQQAGVAGAGPPTPVCFSRLTTNHGRPAEPGQPCHPPPPHFPSPSALLEPIKTRHGPP